MRTIQGWMWAMMVAVGAPLNLWGEAALACAYLFWRTPSVSLPANITPFKAFYGRRPDVSHLHICGCRCFAWVPSELQTKLGDHSDMFLTRPMGHVAWVGFCPMGQVDIQSYTLYAATHITDM